MKRKEFIVVLARGVILSALGVISGILLFRDKDNVTDCDFDFVCGNCKKNENCNLPEAKQYKKNS
ncbi:hypothetical protein ACFLTI_06695 [Bacteroidota bacterium]